MPPEIVLELFQGVRKQKTHPLVPYLEQMAAELTPRQEEVLMLLGEGNSNTQIAQSLHLSEATVRSHINHILNRLGLERRAQAIAYASRRMRKQAAARSDAFVVRSLKIEMTL